MEAKLEKIGERNHPMEKAPSLMTVEEVAEYLQLHPLTVRRLARENKVPFFKLGRQWRAKKELLDQWIEEQSMKNVKDSDQE
jgi:excisionase family DNA binding protein